LNPVLRVPIAQLTQGELSLDAEASRYVVKVHRLKTGDALLLFDPRTGLEGRAQILSDRLPQVVVLVEDVASAPSFEMPVTLVVGVGKSDKPDQAMRDVTAFGAERLVLVHADRSVARSDTGARAERLLRLSEQVARQCGRARLPDLAGPISLREFFQTAPAGQLRLICAFHESGRSLLSYGESMRGSPAGVAILIGPEGGFSEDELKLCLESGCLAVDLGPYVLRTELAVSASLAVARALFLSH
jgi:16S rRNA (uracil1498-N3)-methyltransferase